MLPSLAILAFTVVAQSYTTHVSQEYVIAANDVFFKCGVPSHLADFVTVASWQDSDGGTFLTSSAGKPWFRSLFTVVFTEFKINVAHETYVIMGNSALLRCDVPSFVADLVSVVSWHDNGGGAYLIGSESYGN